MKQVLVIEASHNHQQNGSNYVTGLIEKALSEKYPAANVIRHDYANSPLPHLEASTVQAIFTPPDQQTDSLKSAIKLSNDLSAELLASDLLVLSMPMWNFSVPSSIKAWIDHVIRSGATFNYTQTGVQGLAEKTRAIVVAAAGGVYSQGPMSAWTLDPLCHSYSELHRH